MNNFTIPKNLFKFISSLPVSIIAFISIFIIMSFNYSLNLADFGDYMILVDGEKNKTHKLKTFDMVLQRELKTI